MVKSRKPRKKSRVFKAFPAFHNFHTPYYDYCYYLLFSYLILLRPAHAGACPKQVRIAEFCEIPYSDVANII